MTMNKKVKTTLYIIVIAGGLFASYSWLSIRYVPILARSQINQIIRKHDVRKIKKISANKKTEKFLISLKSDVHCREVSDFQGGTTELGYYSASIKDTQVGIYMEKKSNLYWKIKKITSFNRENTKK